MATGNETPSKEQPVLNIVGELVALGPLREDLLPVYGRWINDFGTIRMTGLPPGPAVPTIGQPKPPREEARRLRPP